MVDVASINNSNDLSFSSKSSYSKKQLEDESLFLEEKLENIKDKQGFLGQTWNGVKELTTLGVSESDCENMLEKYNSGEISFDEAVKYLDEFDSKQKNMSSLLSNIATGVGAIAIATSSMVTGGLSSIGWGLAVKAGAPIGAVLKTGINLLDRATNDIEGDALDAKQMAKDAISGAITGTTSAVSSNIGRGYKTIVNGVATKGNIATSVKNGIECGLACGALSGSTSYMTDVAFGDKDFELGELAENTLSSSMVSGVVGGAVGAGMYGLTGMKVDSAIANSTTIAPKTLAQKIATDSSTSSTRKFLGSKTKEVLGLA